MQDGSGPMEHALSDMDMSCGGILILSACDCMHRYKEGRGIQHSMTRKRTHSAYCYDMDRSGIPPSGARTL